MSVLTVAAAAAGVLFAAAIGDLADLLAAWRARPRERPRRRRMRATTAVLVRVGRLVGSPPAPLDLASRLAAAGSSLSVADAMAIKAGGAVAGLLAALPLAAAAPGRLGLLLPLLATGGGFLALDVGLGRRASARARAMAGELPDVLDLLRVVMAAGLPPLRALGEVGARHAGLLGAELRRAAARAALGESRRDVLAALERRVPLPQMAAATAALERAETLGAPPAEALAVLAAEARAARARARMEAAARAAPKIQLVVALLLVPAVMLLVAAALAPAVLEAT